MAGVKFCRKCKKPKSQCNCGRPEKIDATVLQKLEDAFSNGFPDREACLYAGIAPGTLYNYQLKHPEFIERKEALKLTPNLKARRAIVDALGDPNHAWKWLEKKDPELKPTTKIEHAGQIGVVDETKKEAVKEAIAAANQVLREALRKAPKKTNENTK